MKNNQYPLRDLRGKSSNRRGVALLLVVGLIALLMISTMAFTVMMTIERSASTNYRNSTQARQLIYAGLAQAISDIDSNVADRVYPSWTNNYAVVVGASGGRVVTNIPADVFPSIDYTKQQVSDIPSSARVLSLNALKYIPLSLWDNVENTPAEYQTLSVTNSGIPNIVGRYAYVAVNVSGLLDANYVGGSSRWLGATPGEIQVEAAPDISSATTFTNSRANTYQRYESVAELAQLANAGLQANPSPPPANTVDNFETFSYAPPELQPDGKTPKVYIGGTAAQLIAKHNDITNAFAKCFASSVPLADPVSGQGNAAEWAYDSLVDYVSPSSAAPTGTGDAPWGRPASKDAAQIASVALTMKYTWTSNVVAGVTNITHTVTYYVTVGLVRPFVNASPIGIQYNVSVSEFLVNNNSPATPAVFTPLFPFTPSTTLTSIGPAQQSPPITPQGKGVVTFALSPAKTITISSPPSSLITSATNNCYIGFAVQVTDPSGNIVDQVPAEGSGYADTAHCILIGYNKVFGSPDKPLPSNDGSLSEQHTVWAEAIDPAINWDGYSTDGQWLPSESNPSQIVNANCLSNLTTAVALPFGANFFAPKASINSGKMYSTSADQTYVNKVKSSISGGLLSSYLLTNRDALVWWNQNVGTATLLSSKKVPIIPDGVRLGEPDNSHWDPLDMQIRHYVKGAPLESVGELGYLNIGRWMTINLYPHGHDGTVLNNMLPSWQFHRVLDYFTLRDPNAATNGLVNLNSTVTNVHACVFDQMPLNEGGGGAARLGKSDAVKFAQYLITKCGNTNQYLSALGNFWTNATPLGCMAGTAISAPLGLSDPAYPASLISAVANPFGEFEREAVIRNIANLYTTRQQIYTIIIRADALSASFGGMNPTSVGSSYGVFQIWRDPEADANGNHPCFVRLCKILTQ